MHLTLGSILVSASPLILEHSFDGKNFKAITHLELPNVGQNLKLCKELYNLMY